MCGSPLSVHSLVTGLAISLYGSSCLATCTCLNSQNTLCLEHFVFLCNRDLHSSFLQAVCCPMASLAADVAVPRESATLILLRLTGTTLALETRAFLAVSLRLFPASALALGLALLVLRFCLGATWFAGPATASALIALVSPHECQVIPLSNELSLMLHCKRMYLHPFAWCIP